MFRIVRKILLVLLTIEAVDWTIYGIIHDIITVVDIHRGRISLDKIKWIGSRAIDNLKAIVKNDEES